MSLRPRPLALSVTASILVASCGGGNLASQLAKAPGDVVQAMKGQSKCGVSKSQEHPLIVEWPSPDRMELENKVRRGLVVVRYQGCEMSVLPRCSVPAKYGYQGATHKRDRVEMTDADDLYANLPVGAAKLEGKLTRSGKLTVEMNLVGRYEAERPSVRVEELQGECAGATHFVYGVTVGAFDFYAGGGASVGGGVSVGAVGAGGHSEAARETLSSDGEAAACSKATMSDSAPPEGCGALVRIDVVPIQGAAGATTPPAASPVVTAIAPGAVVSAMTQAAANAMPPTAAETKSSPPLPGAARPPAPLASTQVVAQSETPRESTVSPAYWSRTRITGGVMTGAGVVGMGVGGIVGLMAKSKFSTADGETGSKRVSDSDSAVSTGNTASVIVGVGGALAAAGLVVWFVAPSLSGSTKASVGLNGNELVVGGSF